MEKFQLMAGDVVSIQRGNKVVNYQIEVDTMMGLVQKGEKFFQEKKKTKKESAKIAKKGLSTVEKIIVFGIALLIAYFICIPK